MLATNEFLSPLIFIGMPRLSILTDFQETKIIKLLKVNDMYHRHGPIKYDYIADTALISSHYAFNEIL